MKRRAFIVAAVSLAMISASPARAQSVEEFYRGKTITILVGFTAGGGYDLYARLLGRHMSGHIPGKPAIVVQNMPGAGSMKAAQFVYGVAPKDGLTLATVSRGMATEPLLNPASTGFDPTKLTWLGTVTSETSVCATWKTSPVKTWPDMFTREFSLGGSAIGADPDTFALILRNVFGARVKLVTGYPGGNDINLAMERGEVEGRGSNAWASWKSTRMDWIRDKKINMLVQIGLTKAPDLPDVPLMMDLAKNPDDKAVLKLLSASTTIGRPLFTSPGVPEERVKALRAAFDATMKDPEFLADAKTRGFDINPVSGEEMQKIVVDIVATPRAIADRLQSIIGTE